jgi:hypothetical protein
MLVAFCSPCNDEDLPLSVASTMAYKKMHLNTKQPKTNTPGTKGDNFCQAPACLRTRPHLTTQIVHCAMHPPTSPQVAATAKLGRLLRGSLHDS